MFLSTDQLQTMMPVPVRDRHDAEYLSRTPQNPANPGWHFHTLSGMSSWVIKGREILVWGNYCSVIEGAAPVNIYYSTDGGRTVKIAYAFGQNPFYRDNGSGCGGPNGTPLGDPDNPVFCRHIHSVAYHPAEDAFYACTEDHDWPLRLVLLPDLSELLPAVSAPRQMASLSPARWGWRI